MLWKMFTNDVKEGPISDYTGLSSLMWMTHGYVYTTNPNLILSQ
jgi:hypothetical protein